MFGLIVAIMGALFRSRSTLAPAVLAGWVMLLPLALIFDWLEQPPFMVVLRRMLTGVALLDGEDTSLDGVDVRATQTGVAT